MRKYNWLNKYRFAANRRGVAIAAQDKARALPSADEALRKEARTPRKPATPLVQFNEPPIER